MKRLVLIDVSGSTPATHIQRILDLAVKLDADIATFDTQIRLWPIASNEVTAKQILGSGGGGTLINSVLKQVAELQDLHPLYPAGKHYNVMYVIGDMFMEPVSEKVIELFNNNFYFLCIGAAHPADPANNLAEVTDASQARRYERDLKPAVEQRIKALGFDEYAAHYGV